MNSGRREEKKPIRAYVHGGYMKKIDSMDVTEYECIIYNAYIMRSIWI